VSQDAPQFRPLKGENFQRRYDENELTRLVKDLARSAQIWFSGRVLERMKDLGLDPLEVEDAVGRGRVSIYEVAPSRTEMRLEIEADGGDVERYRFVVWLSRDHQLFAEDVREKPEGRRP
jgi:hypothetical protein